MRKVATFAASCVDHLQLPLLGTDWHLPESTESMESTSSTESTFEPSLTRIEPSPSTESSAMIDLSPLLESHAVVTGKSLTPSEWQLYVKATVPRLTSPGSHHFPVPLRLCQSFHNDLAALSPTMTMSSGTGDFLTVLFFWWWYRDLSLRANRYFFLQISQKCSLCTFTRFILCLTISAELCLGGSPHRPKPKQ